MSEELRIDPDTPLVRDLLTEHAPRWAHLPLERVSSTGVNNTSFRLGDRHVVRMPQTAWSAEHIRKEQRWLPVLGPQLPLDIPKLTAIGPPSTAFPWHWSIYEWLDGEEAVASPPSDEDSTARNLARFLMDLQRIPTGGGPRSGLHSGLRGVPLPVRDEVVRTALRTISREFDITAATAAWDAAIRVPPWREAPVWIHGDIHPTNVLIRQGVFSAVIDWELLSVGDPAVDLAAAWMLLDSPGRDTMRGLLPADEDTWARARGWALCIGVIATAYYSDTNPVLAGFSRKAADDAIAGFLQEA
jgi:aminoglycoside phosphotransferase (APT) family kinase protein